MMQTNQTILNSRITHIMSNTGTGKTYYAKNLIDEIIKNGKNIIYVSIYNDIIVDSDLIQKIFIKDENDIKKIDITDKNLHIIFDRKTIGEEESNNLANKFILSNIEQNKFSKNIYLVLDDMQIYQASVLEKVIKTSFYTIFIHQYVQQLDDSTQFLILTNCEKGVYFNMPKSNIDVIRIYFKENDASEIDSISKFNEYEYVILDKKTIEDKKQIRETIDSYFDAFYKKDIEKIESIAKDTILFIFSDENNFTKEEFKINFEKIKFEGENNIENISVDADWAYVHNKIKMSIDKIDQNSNTMFTLRKIDGKWLIDCVQSMQII